MAFLDLVDRGAISDAATVCRWTYHPPTPRIDFRIRRWAIAISDGERLILKKDEAGQVREMFNLYIEKGCLLASVQELRRRGGVARPGRLAP